MQSMYYFPKKYMLVLIELCRECIIFLKKIMLVLKKLCRACIISLKNIRDVEKGKKYNQIWDPTILYIQNLRETY